MTEEIKNTNMDDMFRFVGSDVDNSEKIIAPRYSYWKSVMRVFFRKKINIVLLLVLAIIVLTAFIMPTFWHYDLMENVTDSKIQGLSCTSILSLLL